GAQRGPRERPHHRRGNRCRADASRRPRFCGFLPSDVHGVGAAASDSNRSNTMRHAPHPYSTIEKLSWMSVPGHEPADLRVAAIPSGIKGSKDVRLEERFADTQPQFRIWSHRWSLRLGNPHALRHSFATSRSPASRAPLAETAAALGSLSQE